MRCRNVALVVLAVFCVPTGRSVAETELVRIPAGAFKMGCVSTKAASDEKPLHEVKVAEFSIARTEVTNGEYAKFIEAKGYATEKWWSKDGWAWREAAEVTMPDRWDQLQAELGDAFPSHPVVGVSYYEAEAYAAFVGMRLPTEAEWEKAARGTERVNVFPWGDDPEAGGPPGGTNGRTRPVGTNEKDRSPYGLLDMGGNVAEWTSSWYAAYPGGAEGPHFGQKYRVVRGGSWRFEVAHKRRVAWRGYFRYGNPDARSPMVGFRLAK